MNKWKIPLWAAAAAALIGVTGCTNPDNARRVLEGAGYSNIEMKGWTWLGCSEDDTVHDVFTATGPTGKTISGVVCSQWFFKGATIRLD